MAPAGPASAPDSPLASAVTAPLPVTVDRPGTGDGLGRDALGPARPPGAGPGRHQRPVRSFKVIGIFVLVLGAVAGGYLTFIRPQASANPVAAELSMATVAPTVSPTDPAKAKALADAKALAVAAALEAAAKAKKANDTAAREKEEASRSGSRTNTQYPVPGSCNEYTGNRAIGCALLLQAGFGLDQMPCLDKLFTRESGWNPLSNNPSSGAYGIPQALPGDKMKGYGADWKTNPIPQINWGLDYIKSRYGNPCGAWAHSQATNWY